MWYENAIIYGVDVLVESGVTCTCLLARDPSGSGQTVTLDLGPGQAPRLSDGLEYILPVTPGEPAEIERNGLRWFENPA